MNQIDYVLPGVGMVEVFIDRDQAHKEQIEKLARDLSLRPAAAGYLKILNDHPVTAKVHGVHKAVMLPSLPAFQKTCNRRCPRAPRPPQRSSNRRI